MTAPPRPGAVRMAGLGFVLPLLVLLVACTTTPPVGDLSIGFHAFGTGYRSAPARLRVEPSGALRLEGGPEGARVEVVTDPRQGLARLDDALGHTVPVASGALTLPDGRVLTVRGGTFTLQALQSGVARGNFEVKVDASESVEVRGSFDATAAR